MSSSSLHSKEQSLDTDHEPINQIQTAGDGDEFVIIGNTKYYRHELMQAFGGTLNPGLSPPPVHQFANPAPLGLCAFGLTTLVLSMVNARAMGISIPHAVLGLAAFYGGAVQFLAGVWEMAIGNTFGATALTSYGAFWLSYAAILIPSFGVEAAYKDAPQQKIDAISFFLLGWTIFTFMMTLLTLKSTIFFCALFSCLFITFLLLCLGDFTQTLAITRAGGVVGVITAFLGFYNAYAGTSTPQNSYFGAKVFHLTKA
ncbi:Ammonia transport outward protein 2 [Spathaspora sp. JA1]|nr:Ammonia transport outward protein 2 [Spathaspora sp. JA1]